ncbi:Sir2 family [Geosmithia morbida]|uniref:Sir2 family n=1 Tax=Geosmithia morbida TaxID=1094350 RepID=A0A9P5D645_9HYPO|nr:Sir2 family [Geosmithia morbida]KAF4123124.1 Sir2 family [Geosmithia morbida]
MRKSLIRIPYTHALPPPTIIPATADTLSGAVAALIAFLTATPDHYGHLSSLPSSTVVLSGAGLSVASGLADYRGPKGTYREEYPRDEFQHHLSRLNPRWDDLLRDAMAAGALDAENSGAEQERPRFKGIRTNPDGDVDLPDAPYTTFRYPPCPKCLSDPPVRPDGSRHIVEADAQGAWTHPSTAGVLKPAVVMFGENIADSVKSSAEDAIDSAGKLLVLGTSLATYSAWRLAKRAADRGMPIAIVSMGGVRGEDSLFGRDLLGSHQIGEEAVRTELATQDLLPALVSHLRKQGHDHTTAGGEPVTLEGHGVFKDMLS